MVAEGLDRDWIGEARCREGRRMASSDSGFMWTILPGERRDGIRGDKWIELALLECGLCPVQWACTHYAIASEAFWGTWGCSQDDRAFLSKQSGWETELLMASSLGQTVQAMVAEMRRDMLGCEGEQMRYKVTASVQGLGNYGDVVEITDDDMVEMFSRYLEPHEDEDSDDELVGVFTSVVAGDDEVDEVPSKPARGGKDRN